MMFVPLLIMNGLLSLSSASLLDAEDGERNQHDEKDAGHGTSNADFGACGEIIPVLSHLLGCRLLVDGFVGFALACYGLDALMCTSLIAVAV